MSERSLTTRKLAWRVAGRIREQLHKLRFNRLLNVRHDYRDLSSHLDRWRKATRHTQLVIRKRWLGVLPAIRRSLDYLFIDLQRELTAARRITEQWEPLTIPAFRDLIADLEQIKDEFGGWQFRDNVLSVTTEPITLESVYLGSFAIKLQINHFDSLDRQRIYEVEALDPNPAEGHSNTTHPHVRDDELCEGDASVPIKSALEQGRVADFFLLVKSVLTTYNAGSPYVALDLWAGGVSCYHCGTSVSDDDRTYCEHCDHDVCNDCCGKCEACDSYYCTECLSTCPRCDCAMCKDCRRSCEQCGEAVCVDCLENDVCTQCQKEQDEADEPDEPDDDGREEGEHEGEGGPLGLPPADDDANTPPDPAILAICLGEAAGVS
ncbi:MAG: hypothetical protein WD768_03890 [Phycisphaeraceae bacterium]